MADLTFKPVIGLEIHVQLATKSKLFCSCSTDYIGVAPNTNVCPACLGLPGSLPALNAKAVEYGVKAALALNCTINTATRFHRKNYFYADLPKAYQISQYDLPIAEKGYVDVSTEEGGNYRIGITRLHLEEDAGKLVHEASDGRLVGADQSFVDYNRGGIPLAEIVSEPDIRSAAEAKEYVTRLRQLVRYLGVSDGDMEKGSLRVDANISVKCSDGRWGNRAEIKNLNSLRALERALEYEIKRQSQLLAEGEEITQETRHWDDVEGVTRATRSKEEAHDYRYFPEPDLAPLILPEGYVEKVRNTLPELPWQKMERFMSSYELNETDAMILSEHMALADFYEACVKAGASPLRASNWVRTEVLRVMNEQKIDITEFPVDAAALAQLIAKVDGNKISTTAAREVFDTMAAKKVYFEEAMKICGVEEGGISGSDLEKMIRNILVNNTDVVETIKSGQDKKGKKQKFLQGLIMKEARGQTDPREAASLLAKLLEE